MHDREHFATSTAEIVRKFRENFRDTRAFFFFFFTADTSQTEESRYVQNGALLVGRRQIYLRRKTNHPWTCNSCMESYSSRTRAHEGYSSIVPEASNDTERFLILHKEIKWLSQPDFKCLRMRRLGKCVRTNHCRFKRVRGFLATFVHT